MGARENHQNNITYLKLKAKTSDTDPTPYFGRNEKRGDSWEIVEKFSARGGYLKDISHATYEYEGETKYKCSMKLVDTDGTIDIIEANFSNLLYGILNALLSCKPEMIEISVWLGSAKAGDKRYPSAGVTNNGDKLSWSMPYDETPKPVVTMVDIGTGAKKKQQKVTDDSNVIEFWSAKIDEIKATLNTDPVIPHPSAENTANPMKPVESTQETDDLPF